MPSHDCVPTRASHDPCAVQARHTSAGFRPCRRTETIEQDRAGTPGESGAQTECSCVPTAWPDDSTSLLSSVDESGQIPPCWASRPSALFVFKHKGLDKPPNKDWFRFYSLLHVIFGAAEICNNSPVPQHPVNRPAGRTQRTEYAAPPAPQCG
jgi:hypothetical protein